MSLRITFNQTCNITDFSNDSKGVFKTALCMKLIRNCLCIPRGLQLPFIHSVMDLRKRKTK